MLTGVDIGRMDLRLTIEQPIRSKNAIGETVDSWSTLTTVWGERLTGMRGAESFQGEQQVGLTTETYKIRHLSTVTQNMRISENGGSEKFYIRTVHHRKREGFTVLTAEKKDNE